MSRPLKDKHISFRIPSADKTALKEYSFKLAQAIEKSQGVEDLTPAKVARRLVDAFNEAMKAGEQPVFPFKLLTAPKTETPLPEPKEPKQKRVKSK